MTQRSRFLTCATSVCLLLTGCVTTNTDGNDNAVGNQNENDNTNADSNTNDNASSNDNSGGSTAGTAYVTFLLNDSNDVYRMEARAGSEVENLSPALDALGTGKEDGWINISPDGAWLLLSTDRFDADCAGWPCLAVVDSDITAATTVRAAGAVIHPWGFSAIATGGNLIVYSDSGGPHEVDLWAIRRAGGAWSAPTLLTGDSAYPFNEQPAASSDGSKVVFDGGPVPYGQEGSAICEVGTDGAGFRVVRAADDPPAGYAAGGANHHADYDPDDAGIVFEGNWDGERVWRAPADGGDPFKVGGPIVGVSTDNSPCVLPDGRIAVVTYGFPLEDGSNTGGEHEIKIMDADGGNAFMLFRGHNLYDTGIGCGGSATASPGGDGEPARTNIQYFPVESLWYSDISTAPLDGQSDEVIAWLDGAGGWGTGQMRIDFSIEVLTADGSSPHSAFIPTEDHYSPDCDTNDVPLPPGGALEGETAYSCDGDGDCHLIVADESTQRLYEMWRANQVGDMLYGGCLAVWDMTRVYDPSGRGENCTSADAAGYPIAPLLFTADEVAAGSIDHAIRFILPNSRIREGVYVHPATHSTGAASGPASAAAYGTRLRLRADYPVDTLPGPGARVVARAMQRYGMFLADGGNIALTAQSDRFTTAKWAGLLETHDLGALLVTDFEMVDAGPRLSYTGDCAREP